MQTNEWIIAVDLSHGPETWKFDINLNFERPVVEESSRHRLFISGDFYRRPTYITKI